MIRWFLLFYITRCLPAQASKSRSIEADVEALHCSIKSEIERMRPKLVLFGDSITEGSFMEGGWGATLAHHFSRTVSSLITRVACSSSSSSLLFLVSDCNPSDWFRRMWCCEGIVGTTHDGHGWWWRGPWMESASEMRHPRPWRCSLAPTTLASRTALVPLSTSPFLSIKTIFDPFAPFSRYQLFPEDLILSLF